MNYVATYILKIVQVIGGQVLHIHMDGIYGYCFVFLSVSLKFGFTYTYA